MTTNERTVNRRRALLLAAGSVTVGLAGCLGDDDDEEEENGDEENGEGRDENGDDEDEEKNLEEIFEENSGERKEVAEDAAEWWVDIVNNDRVEAYNNEIHEDSGLEQLEGNGMGFGITVELLDYHITEYTDSELSIEISVEYELIETHEEEWKVDYVLEGDTLQIWDHDIGIGETRPALSPETPVEDFVDALSEGNTARVEELLHEESANYEMFTEEFENFEGTVELDDIDRVEDEGTHVFIDATVTIDGDGGSATEVWSIRVEVVDGEWKLLFLR